jgi:glycosyltransferase involved in cell wall biosynthesis
MRRHRYDLLWIEKEALPWTPAWLELSVLRGVPVVLDLDDNWGERYTGHRSTLVRTLLHKKIDSVLREAVLVIAGNEYLAEHARRIGARRVEIVPSTIDLAAYPSPAVPLPDALGRPAVIGWIGTPLNAHYLSLVEPALRTLSRTVPITLHVVGGSIPPELAGLAVEKFEWSESTEVERIGAFDVGIMPLNDAPWERGKSAYKLLQVMAAGKPVVASPVGTNKRVVRHGVNGYLASSNEEWAEALRVLCTDLAANRRMGLEARKTVVEDGYTLDAATAQVVELLQDIVRK